MVGTGAGYGMGTVLFPLHALSLAFFFFFLVDGMEFGGRDGIAWLGSC